MTHRHQTNYAQEFINIFNEVDIHLRQMAGMGPTVSHMFIIDRLSDTNKFIRDHKEELKLYARLRNAIIHNPFGEEIEIIAQPNPKIVAKYAALRDGIVNPPVALKFAIPAVKIYSTNLESNARAVMQVMAAKVYTYVPVLGKQGNAIGIFLKILYFYI